MPQPQTSRPLRVLVADRSPDTAEALRVLLSLWGHQARVAPDGWQALDEAGRFLPDVAILDLALPGADGYEVASRLSRQPASTRPLLLAVTTPSRPVSQERATAAGFHLCLSKPFPVRLLAALL